MEKITFVDVGAREGIAERWAPFLDHMTVYGFEPDPKECEALNRRRSSITYLPNALGERDGEHATLHVTKQPGCSSLLEPNLDFLNQFPYGTNLEVTHTYPMVLSRLDTVCRERGIRPDAIKIDTQGTELSILNGCGGLLDSMISVELEVEFASMYKGQPLFSDIDQFMRSRGFTLRGLLRSYWRSRQPAGWRTHAYGGQLIHADALYIHHVYSQKAMVLYAAYRQYDLIVHMLAQPQGELAQLPEAERRALAGRLLPKENRFMAASRQFAARYLHNKTLRRFVDSLRPATATDWHDADLF